MENYIHKVHYYETDKMGITHHSNYIKWMEEARVEFLENIGFGYDKLEKMGIISPVIGASLEFKHSSTFDDKIEIMIKVIEFKGVKLVLGYEMKNVDTKEIICTGQTKHCFVNKEGKPIILKKEYPEFDKKIRSYL